MNFSFINRKRYSLLNTQKLDLASKGSVFKYLNAEKAKYVLGLACFAPLVFFLALPSHSDKDGFIGFLSILTLGMMLSLFLFLALLGLEKALLWWKGLNLETPYNHRFSNKNKIRVLEELEENKNSLPPAVFAQIIKTLTDESPSDHWWWQLNMIVNQKSKEARRKTNEDQRVRSIRGESFQDKIKKIDEQVLTHTVDFQAVDGPIGLSIDKKPDHH